MIHKIKDLLIYVDLIKFCYYNMICKSIIREKGSYLIPYKNAVINLHKTARLQIKNGSIKLGDVKLRGSREETYLKMDQNAQWISDGGAELFYNTKVDIQQDGVFQSGFFSANCGTVIVCSKKITFGNNIMLGRNITIYDSDHHQITDRHGHMINYDAEVTLEDCVWLTSNVTVQRGVTIGTGSIVGAHTLVKREIPPYSLAEGSVGLKITSIDKITGWKRDSTHQRETWASVK